MKLTHNPSSGVIKRDGAVVGVIKSDKRRFIFVLYAFDKIECNAPTIEKLLPKIKKLMEEER